MFRLRDSGVSGTASAFDVRLLPPATGGEVLVLRGVDWDYVDDGPGEVIRYYSDLAAAQGKTGPAILHCPLVIEIDADASIELLDEAQMAEAGWIRKPAKGELDGV